jgi:predicted alpha/beta-hydrolase family hydrolase
VEQPWRVAGKRTAPRPAVLDQAWLEIIPALRKALDLEPVERARQPAVFTGARSAGRRRGNSGPRLIVGGRSAGARVACRTARQTAAAGVLALSFPLHPPGRPERSRAGELLEAGVPTLVVQGERDPFGQPEEFPPGSYELVPVPAADHGLAVPKNAPLTRADVLDLVVASTGTWLGAMVN